MEVGRGDDWRTWPTVQVKLEGLPPYVDTSDIHRNLQQHGAIVRINIQETRSGYRSTEATVTFKQGAGTAFSSQPHSHSFTTSDGHLTNVRIYRVTKKGVRFTVQGLVHPNREYERKIVVYGISLAFGVLSAPESMSIMLRQGDIKHQVRMELDLERLQLEIHFPFIFTSSTQSRWRAFRFTVALDNDLDVWRCDGASFVIHLKQPPRYSKQLEDKIRQSHVKGSRVWSEEDSWARQTDIFAHKDSYRKIQRTPISLYKTYNTINIARWTTFKFDVAGDAANQKAVNLFSSALPDFNHKILDGKNFKFQATQVLDSTTWALINGPSKSNDITSLEQLNTVELTFEVRYQLEVCVSRGYISEYDISSGFLQRLSEWPESTARQALVFVDTYKKRIYDLMEIFSDIKYTKPIRPKAIPDNCVELHSATVTASGILFHTPALEATNRIVRKYRQHAHRFLRVRFADDELKGQTRLYSTSNNKMVTIFDRVRVVLLQGIMIGHTKYEFVAWGNSQLREHGVYFFASTGGLNADRIRIEMGEFDEKVIAKKAARMGQCFSTTKAVLMHLPTVSDDNVEPDIIRGRYNFTDGVGKISPLAAQIISDRLNIKGSCPSLFQFRLGGCKGVLTVDKSLSQSGIAVRIRRSQFKFASKSNELEIIRCAEFWQPYLNRQIITCLSSLGVPDKTFLRMQNDSMAALDAALDDDAAAIRVLRGNVDPNLMTLELCKLVDGGFRAVQEPFVVAILRLWRAWSLTYLREKAKIPIQKGAFLLGCVDETATLKGHTSDCPTGNISRICENEDYLQHLPQIFVQYTDRQSDKAKIVEGVCILARNPSLHMGDIRVVYARDVPALHHICDAVVMPQLGDRDLPSMCSGGDLDGDDFIVIWDERLIPEIWNYEPDEYTAAPPKTVDHEIEKEHLVDFFHDYIKFDALGRIAHAHLAAADFYEDGLRSSACRELAALHSHAVDYPKTGVPAIMLKHLERTIWPHFMKDGGKKRTYISRKILGQLYDAVGKTTFEPDLSLPFDQRILNAAQPSESLLQKIQEIKHDYDCSVQRVLAQHSIASEFELWSTFVLKHSKASNDYKFHEEIGRLSCSIKEQFFETLCETAGARDFEHLAPVAVAAYRVTYYQVQLAQREKSDPPFVSFPWVLHDTLVRIARQADDNDATVSSATSMPANVNGEHDKVADAIQEEGTVDIPDVVELGLASTPLRDHLPDPYQPLLSKEEAVEEILSAEENVVLEVVARPPDSDENKPEITLSNAMKTSMMFERLSEANLRKQALDPVLIDSVDNVPSLPFTDPTATLSSEERDQPTNLSVTPNTDAYDIDESSGMPVHDDFSTIHLPQRPRRFENLYSPKSSGTKSQTPKTCYFWKNNNRCIYPDEQCRFAHHDTGVTVDVKKDVTCFFWKNVGKCKHNSEECCYAHYNTGVVAPPPPADHRHVEAKSSSPMHGYGSSDRVATSTPRKSRANVVRRYRHIDSDDSDRDDAKATEERSMTHSGSRSDPFELGSSHRNFKPTPKDTCDDLKDDLKTLGEYTQREMNHQASSRVFKLPTQISSPTSEDPHMPPKTLSPQLTKSNEHTLQVMQESATTDFDHFVPLTPVRKHTQMPRTTAILPANVRKAKDMLDNDNKSEALSDLIDFSSAADTESSINLEHIQIERKTTPQPKLTTIPTELPAQCQSMTRVLAGDTNDANDANEPTIFDDPLNALDALEIEELSD